MSRPRRDRLRAALVAAVLLATILPGAVAAASPDNRPSPDAVSLPGGVTSWIVTVKKGFDSTKEAPGLAKKAGGKVGHTYKHALDGFVFKGSAKAAANLQRNPKVRTIVPDGITKVQADTIETGISRIRANHATEPSAYGSGLRGAGVRVAILDTGIDLTHPDLVDNIDANLGRNCMTAGPPLDGHGHGTHVAGIVAASDNGSGIVGVAPDARIVPIKVLDDTGQGEWSNLICAIDYLTGLATDGDPTNDVRVANMSLGDVGDIGSCSDGFVREAICTSTAAGITYVAAAGNSTVDTATFIPAAYPEVIAVSALTDIDGEPGGAGGCWLFFIFCDDTLAEFSNYGASVDVTAPGTQIESTWTGGGYATEMGTSMASPHVAGVVALALGVNASLSPADVVALLKSTGECPNQEVANPSGDCAGKGQWGNDPDGIAEPLVNALRAAQEAGPYDHPPKVVISSPADGANVAGSVTITVDATDDEGIASVEFLVNGRHLATDANGADGWSTVWSAGALAPGAYTVTAIATDTGSNTGTGLATVFLGTNLQGNWPGVVGNQGYGLLAWNDTSDLVNLPQSTLVLDQGVRYTWAASSTEARVLQSPTGTERRQTIWYDNNQLRFHLTFNAPYTGMLHLYAIDWSTVDRRQRVTVTDAQSPQQVSLSTAFDQGAWMHFPISVAAGGQVTVTADRLAGYNAVMSGVFLGDWVAPPPPIPPGAPTTMTATGTSTNISLAWTNPASTGGSPITGYKVYRGTSSGTETLLTTIGNVTTYADVTASVGQRYYYRVTAQNAAGEGPPAPERFAQRPDVPGIQGNWPGIVGHDGYALLAWNNTSDLVSLPQSTVVLDQGTRLTWAASSTEARVLQSPTGTERRQTIWYDNNQLRFHLTFNSAYTGMLHLYAIDWSTVDRRQRVTVTDAQGPQQVTLSTAFDQGAWLHFPISVAAGGQVTVTADRLGGYNAVMSGVFLGDGSQVTTVPGAPTGLVATPGNATVGLTWTAPASNGGSPITGYKVYRGTSSGTETLLTTLGVVTTYADNAVANGTTYYYQVRALNVPGEGPPSLEAPATPQAPATVPGAPTGLTATRGNTQVSLSWTAPLSNGGSAITGYTATATPGGATCGTTGTTSCTVSGLVNGTAYSFAVTATNAVGTGAASAPASATPATVPGAPTSLVASPGDATVALSWAAPATSGGSSVTGYKIYRGTTSGTGSLLAGPIAGLTFTDGTATNGTTYFYTVRAVNAVGEGGPSTEVPATPQATATAPGAPTGLSATRGDGQVALSWTAPASNGGSSITGYTASATPGGASCSTAGATSCTVTGLTNGTSYTFTVTATNVIGPGPASGPASATPATVPGAPTGLIATRGNGQVALSWIAPASNGGSPVTGYVATAAPGGATCTTTGALSCTVIGLTNGTSYSFTVKASNAVGAGSASAPASATPASVPGAPTGLVATPGNATVGLTWTAPASNGGSPITGYKVYRGTSSGTETLLTTLGVVTTYADNAVANGTTYYYQVTAITVIGESARSGEQSARPATVPGVARNLSAKADRTRGIDLNWAAPTSNGGAPITGYRIYRSTTSGAEVFLVAVGNVTAYTDQANTKGTRYYYRVAAVNGIGTGSLSTESSAIAK